jgi:DNA-binding NarL/FixJ family response regulator
MQTLPSLTGFCAPAWQDGQRRVAVHLTHSCPILRAGLAAILALQADFHVTVHAAAPEFYSDDCIVITDYVTGLRTARLTQSRRPVFAPRVLILTTRDKEWDVRQAVDSGVHGYLLQGCAEQELVAGVRMLARGARCLSEAATRSIASAAGRAALTRREADVLRVLATGRSDKLIARELGIGAGTVKSHIKHLLQKLDATARTHAVVVAMERGLLAERGAGVSDELHHQNGGKYGASMSAF